MIRTTRFRIVTGAAIIGAALLAGFGILDVVHAIILAACAMTVFLVSATVPGEDPSWPAAPVLPHAGARTDLSDLAWAAVTRDGMVTDRVLRRARAIAARRLLVHGVRWDGSVSGDDPDLGWGNDSDAGAHRARAGELLGPGVVQALTTARSVSPRILETWFVALDRLAGTSSTDRLAGTSSTDRLASPSGSDNPRSS
jgi:hypothetical protein